MVTPDSRWMSESGGDAGQARSAARKSEDEELRRLAKVVVMQAADFGNLHDLPRRGELDRPEVGCVLVKREVGRVRARW
jgi:hypothetical protein